MKHMIRIKDRYYYNRRVPEEASEFDPRTLIRVSLKTDSKDIARRKAVMLNEKMEAYWRSLIESRMPHDDGKYAEAIRTARQMGFSYQPMSAVAQLPIDDLVARILALEGAKPKQIEALLGGIPTPELSVKAALEKFWGFAKDKTMNKTPDQIRKWKNPRIKAVENFIRVVGNKDLKALTRDDVIKFRDWWLDRIHKEDKNAGSANKDFIYFKNMVETVSDNMKLGLDTPHLFKKDCP